MNNYNHNHLYGRTPSPWAALFKSYWRTRRYLYLVPATLMIWSLFLMMSYIISSVDPEFTLEKTILQEAQDLSISTVERNPTRYRPIILSPLPQQADIHQWPPNIHSPLCMPKIFVYPDDPKMGDFHVSDTPSDGTNYNADQILLDQLRDKTSSIFKNYVTEDPEEADFFYIPFLGAKYLSHCWFSLGNKGDCDVDKKYAEPMMNHIQHDYPYWRRSSGKDHIMTHPMDRASLYYNSRERMHNATFLTTVGDKRVLFSVEGRSRRYGDIVIPAAKLPANSAKINPTDYLRADGQPTEGERDIFVLFGGQYQDVKPEDDYSEGLHSILFNGLDHQPDYKIAGGWGVEEYSGLLARAKYGFAPRGWAVDTTRIWEYIAFGVVPVVIADGIIEPFEDDLDWDSFIVRIHRNDAHRMDVILRSISKEEYERKRQAVWNHGRQALLDHNAWDLIVRGLCRKGRLEGKRTINHDHHEKLEPDFRI